jgi:nicotinate-nucleotide adenylyltransferase
MTRADVAAPIGVLGGAFDPVHNGHLRLAIEVREALDLDHVRVIPTGIPNHREGPQASPALRVEMLRAAINYAGLTVDTREMDRDRVSYTVETLESLREDFEGRSICLIMGVDAFNGLPQWHRWQELVSLCHLIVATRPRVDLAGNSALVELVNKAGVDDPARLSAASAGLVYFLRIPLLPISSTDIRERLRCGRSVNYLLPDPVLEIIERDRLYGKKT